MHNKILVLGAGRSSTVMIQYLLSQSDSMDWHITVADQNIELAQSKLHNHPRSSAIKFDIQHDADKISAYDIVISLLPPDFHPLVAQACIVYGKNMVTASYASDAMRKLHTQAVEKGVLLMMECGLDPGIDHLSAMQMIDEVKAEGGHITSFKSYCGGLVAPESDDNPWHYKITWNPRNVVLAGQGGVVKYLDNNETKYIGYNKLFERTEKVEVDGWGEFEAYANRDSLAYREIYGLGDCRTLLRGTLRRPGYSKAWNILIQLGLTDDSFHIENSENMTYRQLMEAFLPSTKDMSLFYRFLEDIDIAMNDPAVQKIQWLGWFDEEKTGIANATPAQVLQHLLEKKWKLNPGDKDMVVMKHELVYEQNGATKRKNASLVVTGDNQLETAMAKTVGLPLGIIAKLILAGKITLTGVQLPVAKEIYEPVLKELESSGIVFV